MNALVRRIASILLAAALPALAQYPQKPIRILIGVAPGGASDAAARMVGQALEKSLGQPIVVENRPGAGGALAAHAAFAAAPDGYTLLWAQSSMTGLPMLQKATPFRSFAEFTPVAMICRLPHGLYVHSSVPATTVAQLVAYVRDHPGKLNYATGPLSEFMAAEQFMKATGTSMVRVPYKGGGPAMLDFVAGTIQVYFTPLAQGMPQLDSGKIRMLATIMPARSEHAPGVPTMEEAGIAGVDVPNWNAIVAPPGTPRSIADRLAREIGVALQDAAMQRTFSARYLVAAPSTPAELATAVVESEASWRRFIAENDIPRE
jgi:tripartite-type tricarboxylate transporter receptor subunit TctC